MNEIILIVAFIEKAIIFKFNPKRKDQNINDFQEILKFV